MVALVMHIPGSNVFIVGVGMMIRGSVAYIIGGVCMVCYSDSDIGLLNFCSYAMAIIDKKGSVCIAVRIAGGILMRWFIITDRQQLSLVR